MITEYCRSKHHGHCVTEGCRCVCHRRDEDPTKPGLHHSADN